MTEAKKLPFCRFANHVLKLKKKFTIYKNAPKISKKIALFSKCEN